MTRWLVIAALGCASHPAPATVQAQPPPRPAEVTPPPPPAPPPPLDRDLQRLADRSLAMYRALATALTEAGEDCAAGVAKLDALTAEYGDVVAANTKIIHDGRGAELRAALASHEAELAQAAKQVMSSPVIAHCIEDAAFVAAFDRLVGGRS
jgi:hypothetical protein